MSKVYADKIEPRDSSMDVTIGTSTNTVTLAGNDLRANTVKDAGGNTLWVSDGSGNLSSVNSALTGNLKLLTTQTASSSSSLSFTTLIDSTYDVYIFKWIDVVPASNNVRLGVNFSSDGGSNYNVTKTTSYFSADHSEDNNTAGLQYVAAADLAQATGVQRLSDGVSTGSGDETTSGQLHLFAPSSTTYIKHFYSVANAAGGAWFTESFAAGYCNTTSAINAIQFTFISGTLASGTFKMYGLL